jgi:hypothetical protein
MDPYSPYNKKKGHKNRGGAWHSFQGCFVSTGTYKTIRTTCCLHDFRDAAISEWVVQQYELGMKIEADLRGTVLVL